MEVTTGLAGSKGMGTGRPGLPLVCCTVAKMREKASSPSLSIAGRKAGLGSSLAAPHSREHSVHLLIWAVRQSSPVMGVAGKVTLRA